MSRFDYVKYGEIAIKQQEDAKNAVIGVELEIDRLADGRAKSLAYTKLEECYMWIGKALRDEQIKRGEASPLQEERENS